MANSDLESTPWYANRGIPLGIIIYLIAMTIAGTAYITNLADRLTFMEEHSGTKQSVSNATEHAAMTSRLSVIESNIAEIKKDLNGKK